MYKRTPLLTVSILLLSAILLVACGDTPTTTTPAPAAATTAAAAATTAATLPTYAGATTIPAMPEAFKVYTDGFTSGFKDGGTVQLYKAADDVTKVSASLQEGFKTNGWGAGKSGDQTKTEATFGQGARVQAFTKDNNGAIVLALPGSDGARAVGFDVKDGETIFIVINGTSKNA